MSTILSSKEKSPLQLSTINISEADQEYVLYATAPGLQREDISVSIEKRIITIVSTGNKDQPPSDPSRLNPSEWKKSLKLPENADPLFTSATCINGELQIHIPKGFNTEEKPLLIHVY
jgi:HSP20 family molecular chaperone IbpA